MQHRSIKSRNPAMAYPSSTPTLTRRKWKLGRFIRCACCLQMLSRLKSQAYADGPQSSRHQHALLRRLEHTSRRPHRRRRRWFQDVSSAFLQVLADLMYEQDHAWNERRTRLASGRSAGLRLCRSAASIAVRHRPQSLWSTDWPKPRGTRLATFPTSLHAEIHDRFNIRLLRHG